MDFTAILLEGTFSQEDDALVVHLYRGPKVRVEDTLAPLQGEIVRIVLQHLPQLPLDPDAWGGGSCLHGEVCPFGHHEDPHKILNFVGEGELFFEAGRWGVRSFGGKEAFLPLEHLDGHHGRVAAATLFSVDEIRDKLAESGMLDSVEGIGTAVDNLRDLVERLRRGSR